MEIKHYYFDTFNVLNHKSPFFLSWEIVKLAADQCCSTPFTVNFYCCSKAASLVPKSAQSCVISSGKSGKEGCFIPPWQLREEARHWDDIWAEVMKSVEMGS